MVKKTKKLPSFFQPILWSYNFSAINPEKNKKTIIVNSINYGDLQHWKWIAKYYSKRGVQNVLKKIPASQLRPQAKKLAFLMFDIKKTKYEKRSTNK
ncbi:DUF6922 domain-containing protein [Patescibacteria group bacterium]